KGKAEGLREAAADALGGIGPDAVKAAPTLIGAIKKTKDAELKATVLRSLGSMGYKEADGIAAMTAGLSAKEEEVREAAATALGNMGKAAEPAVPALAEALKDPEEEVRDNALDALGMLGPIAKEAIPAIKAFIEKADDESVREAAAEVLKKIEAKQ